jgi:hypothetical protein
MLEADAVGSRINVTLRLAVRRNVQLMLVAKLVLSASNKEGTSPKK